jgi:pimeloyl-ACP methyl ester carboxylesterase
MRSDLIDPSDRRTAGAQPPVLLVHGLAGSAAGWLAMVARLRAHGVTVATFSFPLFGTSVEQLAHGVTDAVGGLLQLTGAERVHLVGFSLGGVVIAQALADGLLTDNVGMVVTIAAPFGGSPWANLLPLGATVRALRLGSPLLRRLAAAPWADGVRWVVITASLDRVVPGQRGRPICDGAEVVTVAGVGHLGLRLNPCVIDHVVRAVARRDVPERTVA